MKDNVHVCDSRTIPNTYEPTPPDGLGANYSGCDSDMGLSLHQVDSLFNFVSVFSLSSSVNIDISCNLIEVGFRACSRIQRQIPSYILWLYSQLWSRIYIYDLGGSITQSGNTHGVRI